MKNFIAAFLLILLSFCSYAQQTLPNFNVRILPNERISISWKNPYSGCNQLSVQRSYDSLRFFKTIFSPQSPELPQNGFVDNSPAPGMKVYYRIFYVLSGGSYFFTKSKQPSIMPIEESIEPKHPLTNNKTPKAVDITSNKYLEIKYDNPSIMCKPPRMLLTDEPEEDTLYVRWVNIYKKTRDSLIKTMDIDFYKKYKDSIRTKTKDTMVNIGIDEYLIKPFVPKPVWKASVHLFTNSDGYTIMQLPEPLIHHYKVVFMEENKTPIFTINKVTESYLMVDKSNFPHAGWFCFEIYQDDKLFDKNKFFIESDF